MVEPEQVAGIVKSLTKEGAEALLKARLCKPTRLSKPGVHYMAFPCREVKTELVAKALISCRGTLLLLGLAVRSALKENGRG